MLAGVNVLNLYKEAGGYLEGHFLLASGRHSPKFLQSTTVLQYPDKAEQIGKALAAKFDETPDFVVGPGDGRCGTGVCRGASAWLPRPVCRERTLTAG